MTLPSTQRPTPKRGEIWDVDFNPTIGAEIQKVRPAVVVSSDAVGKLPIKLVAPVTEWQPTFAHSVWHVRIDPSQQNGLNKPSSVDALQLRGVDTQRFVRKRGSVPTAMMEEIVAAIAAVVEYQ